MDSSFSFSVQWPGPLDIAMCVEGFRRWGFDGIDYWDGQVWVRTIQLGGRQAIVACVPSGTVTSPTADLHVSDESDVDAIKTVVQGLFVAAHEAFENLLAEDPVIARLESRCTGLRPVLQGDLFTNLIRSITAQQVNLRWAATTRLRLAERFGEPRTILGRRVFSIKPDRLAAADPRVLRALQLTTRKAEYIVNLARCVAEGKIDLDALRAQPDEAVIERLTQLRGIGRWTAEWFLARGLGRPRVVAGDLGVRKAVGAAYLQGAMPSEAEVRRLTSHWQEAAGVAQQLVLQGLNLGFENL
jgi:DNA-3-methyladenine glycosylase II